MNSVRLDIVERLLLRDGESVSITPKARRRPPLPVLPRTSCYSGTPISNCFIQLCEGECL